MHYVADSIRKMINISMRKHYEYVVSINKYDILREMAKRPILLVSGARNKNDKSEL